MIDINIVVHKIDFVEAKRTQWSNATNAFKEV